jgi:hypothetical protein
MSKSLFVFVPRNSLLTRLIIVFTATTLFFSWLTPLMVGHAEALGQLTTRSLTLGSGVPGGTSVTYSYAFTTATAGSIQSLKFVACTTAFQTYNRGSTNLTTGCTAPSGMNINQGTQQGTNGFGTTTAFSRVTSTTGNCTPANNVLCINRPPKRLPGIPRLTPQQLTQPFTLGCTPIRITLSPQPWIAARWLVR